MIYKGKEYYIESYGEMKTSDGWMNCVIYVALESGKRYVRETSDFNSKFESV